MFVVAMKTTRTRLTVCGAVLLMLLAVAFAAVRSQPSVVATVGGGDTGRVALLKELGYQVIPQWTAVREVTLPATLEGEWAAYQEQQTACGYDLTPYLGERVKCYTYTVVGYPGHPQVQANVYEYDETVIAGDITGTGEEPFSHGLQPQGEANGATG